MRVASIEQQADHRRPKESAAVQTMLTAQSPPGHCIPLSPEKVLANGALQLSATQRAARVAHEAGTAHRCVETPYAEGTALCLTTDRDRWARQLEAQQLSHAAAVHQAQRDSSLLAEQLAASRLEADQERRSNRERLRAMRKRLQEQGIAVDETPDEEAVAEAIRQAQVLGIEEGWTASQQERERLLAQLTITQDAQAATQDALREALSEVEALSCTVVQMGTAREACEEEARKLRIERQEVLTDMKEFFVSSAKETQEGQERGGGTLDGQLMTALANACDELRAERSRASELTLELEHARRLLEQVGQGFQTAELAEAAMHEARKLAVEISALEAAVDAAVVEDESCQQGKQGRQGERGIDPLDAGFETRWSEAERAKEAWVGSLNAAPEAASVDPAHEAPPLEPRDLVTLLAGAAGDREAVGKSGPVSTQVTSPERDDAVVYLGARWASDIASSSRDGLVEELRFSKLQREKLQELLEALSKELEAATQSTDTAREERDRCKEKAASRELKAARLAGELSELEETSTGLVESLQQTEEARQHLLREVNRQSTELQLATEEAAAALQRERHQAQEVIQTLQERDAALEEEIDLTRRAAGEDLAQCLAVITALKAQLAQVEQDKEGLLLESGECKDQLFSLRGDFAREGEALSQREVELVQAQAEADSFWEDILAMTAEGKHEVHTQQQAQIASLEQQLQAAEGDLAARNAEVASLEHGQMLVNDVSVELMEAKLSLQSELQLCQAETEAGEARDSAVNALLAESEERCETLEEELRGQVGINRILTQELSQAWEAATALREDRDRLQGELREAVAVHSEMGEAHDQARERWAQESVAAAHEHEEASDSLKQAGAAELASLVAVHSVERDGIAAWHREEQASALEALRQEARRDFSRVAAASEGLRQAMLQETTLREEAEAAREEERAQRQEIAVVRQRLENEYTLQRQVHADAAVAAVAEKAALDLALGQALSSLAGSEEARHTMQMEAQDLAASLDVMALAYQACRKELADQKDDAAEADAALAALREGRQQLQRTQAQVLTTTSRELCESSNKVVRLTTALDESQRVQVQLTATVEAIHQETKRVTGITAVEVRRLTLQVGEWQSMCTEAVRECQAIKHDQAAEGMEESRQRIQAGVEALRRKVARSSEMAGQAHAAAAPRSPPGGV